MFPIGTFRINFIVAGNGNQDIYAAITFAATKLIFRPGVSKQFILMPCSKCQESSMQVSKLLPISVKAYNRCPRKASGGRVVIDIRYPTVLFANGCCINSNLDFANDY